MSSDQCAGLLDHTKLGQPSLRLVGAVRVDVEIDVLDAALRPTVLATGAPRPVDHLGAAHLHQRQAFPLPAHRAPAAAALELPCQRLLGSIGVAENDGAESA